MSSITLLRESLEYKLNSQLYLLSCITEEIRELERERNTLSKEEYTEALAELQQYKGDVLSEVKVCEESLIKYNNENKKIVLKQMGFKKGGQSW